MVKSSSVLRSTSAAAIGAGAVLALLGLAVRGASPAAASTPVGLGTAASFAVIAGSTVTNTGPSVISGDVGVSSGSSITGFPPGIVNAPATQHIADAVVIGAQNDVTTAYNTAAGETPVTTVATELAGTTLQPGIYASGGAIALNGTVTLDNSTDPNALFVFQSASTLITGSGSSVAFTDSAHPDCNVYWQVSSSATLGTDSAFAGTVLASASITAETGATVIGRLLAGTGAVTLDTNTITVPLCTTPTSTATTPSGTTTPTSTAAGTATSAGTPNGASTTPNGALAAGTGPGSTGRGAGTPAVRGILSLWPG
jgi:type VI secretion system secreted protein VgrG